MSLNAAATELLTEGLGFRGAVAVKSRIWQNNSVCEGQIDILVPFNLGIFTEAGLCELELALL